MSHTAYSLTADGTIIYKAKQRMYKVGFGSNMNAIISEDSLDRWDWLPGCIEYHGEREIYYVLQTSEDTI